MAADSDRAARLRHVAVPGVGVSQEVKHRPIVPKRKAADRKMHGEYVRLNPPNGLSGGAEACSCRGNGGAREIEDREIRVAGATEASHEDRGATSHVDNRRLERWNDLLDQSEREGRLLLIPADLRRSLRAVDAFPMSLEIHGCLDSNYHSLTTRASAAEPQRRMRQVSASRVNSKRGLGHPA